MNYEEIAEQVRYLIGTEPGRTWKVNEIGNILGCRGRRAKALKSVLDGMVEDGTLTCCGKSGYIAGEGKNGTITGKLDLTRSGAGFVADPESGKSIRIPQEYIGTALPGDTVSVQLIKGRDAQVSGKITKIVSRAGKLIVGTFSSSGRRKFVIPIDPVYKNDIEVEDGAGANDGDRVVVKISDWQHQYLAPKGEIIEVIGPSDKPSLDTETVCREYELPGPFPAAAVEEASNAVISPSDYEGRLDLRDSFILTVDPETARDYDDAISLEILPGGVRRLGVHIADVSHFVRPGSALDDEAASRGTSVYLVDKVIPMLPEQLCNGLCSLRPDEDRLTFSVFMDFNEAGKMVRRSFAKSVIRSKLRLTYAQALAAIEGGKADGETGVLTAEAEAILKGCADLAMQLRSIRMRAGALDLDLPESEILLDSESRMTGIVLREYDISHQMIEECMVAANEAVATELSVNGVRVMARLHEPPDPLKLDDLAAQLSRCGFTTGDISTPAGLSRFLASIVDHPLRAQAQTLVLRSMKRAIYNADSHGHFGLAKHYYSHFTSPIRRYPDLILHRQLSDYIASKGRRQTISAGHLKEMSLRCTELESRADDASRALLEIKKYRYLQQQIDDRNSEVYTAVISKVTSFGLFVDVNLLQIGGLIHISHIPGGRAIYNAYKNTISAGGATYRLGGEVKVFVARVDFLQRMVDFEIAEEAPARQTAGKTAMKAAKKADRKKAKLPAKPKQNKHSVKYGKDKKKQRNAHPRAGRR